jgi:hypothetical protein
MSHLFGQSSVEFSLKADDGVGRSDRRTPAKHGIQRRYLGAIVGAAPHVAARFGTRFDSFLIVDLTAGNAAGYGPASNWLRSSSPGIIANLGLQREVEIEAVLIERQQATYLDLCANLHRRLSDYGYVATGDASWRHRMTGSTITAINDDACNYQYCLRQNQWLAAINDPNHRHDWVLDMGQMAGLVCGGAMVHFMSTMGCNANGIKRLPLDERVGWFADVDKACQIARMFPRLDLLLYIIHKDAAQWAYLLLVPYKWVGKTSRQMNGAFRNEGLPVDEYSFKRNEDEFLSQFNHLFFTKSEINQLYTGEIPWPPMVDTKYMRLLTSSRS